MWKFPGPPPPGAIDPIWFDLPRDARIHRVYDSRYCNGPSEFRDDRRRARFDHHVAAGDRRAILYGADDVEGCFVEVYGDNPRVGYALQRRHCTFRLTRQLRLLDLRGPGAMAAGTSAKISKGPHDTAQDWSCHFYEHPDEYELIDGLVYYNSHDDRVAYAFYERCEDAFADVRSDHALSEPARRDEYVAAARAAHVDVDFDVTTDPDEPAPGDNWTI